MPDTTPQPNLDARLIGIADMRTRFRETTDHPLRKAAQHPNALMAAIHIAQIPIEAAAAGFDVSIARHSNGWHLVMQRRIDVETGFYAAAKAKSLSAALVALVEAGLTHLEQLDTETRCAIRIAEAAPTGAAVA